MFASIIMILFASISTFRKTCGNAANVVFIIYNIMDLELDTNVRHRISRIGIINKR